MFWKNTPVVPVGATEKMSSPTSVLKPERSTASQASGRACAPSSQLRAVTAWSGGGGAAPPPRPPAHAPPPAAPGPREAGGPEPPPAPVVQGRPPPPVWGCPRRGGET